MEPPIILFGRQRPRKLLSLKELSSDHVNNLIRKAYLLKHARIPTLPYAKNAVLVLYMEKRSTRTRLSCTVAWTKLGGTVIDLSPQDGKSHIDVNENLYDSFRVISDMADCIVARVNEHETLNTICKAANDSRRKPIVINGLSDQCHPLQILADMLTMYEDGMKDIYSFSELPDPLDILKNKSVAWIGDNNNVLRSLAVGLPMIGMNFKACIPADFAESARSLVQCVDTPVEALEGADYVITDTWVSMGDEHEKEVRMRHFAGFQVNEKLIEAGNPNVNWRFLHCLPRKKEEVSDGIFYGKRSLVFQEAENRIWTVLAVFAHLLTTTW